LSCSNIFSHAPTFSCDFCEKYWSMIKKIGAWQKYWSMTTFFSSCSNFFVMLPGFEPFFGHNLGAWWQIWEHDNVCVAMVSDLGAWDRYVIKCHLPFSDIMYNYNCLYIFSLYCLAKGVRFQV
jgi:hypothetical protein